MLKHLRKSVTKVMDPIAGLLIRLGVTPDLVTLLGTLGVVCASLWFFPRGELFLGSAVVGIFALFDLLDGVLARKRGSSGRWGAFLDSTLDRVADSAVFVGLAWWFLGDGNAPVVGGLALLCLVLGSLVSYAKARAEGLGCTCNVGIAERADRLVAVLAAAGLAGLGLWPQVLLPVVFGGLAIASAITVYQRMDTVRQQTRSDSNPKTVV